jgi:membrane complex biogenesis BtpA family protein
MDFTEKVFGCPRPLIGVIHVLPLPGSPRWSGDMDAVVGRASADAKALSDAGFDGVIVENYGDAPFARGFSGRGAVAGLAVVGARVRDASRLPVGVNVLRNDALSAVAVAAAIGGRFIRVNVHVGAAVTDQGIVQGDAMETMRSIREMAPGLGVVADVLVKHSLPLVDAGLAEVARDTVERGLANALIVTGPATGAPASMDDLSTVKAAVPDVPVFIGSGVTADTVRAVLERADGIIVGSSIMESGEAGGAVDPARARTLVSAAGGEARFGSGGRTGES